MRQISPRFRGDLSGAGRAVVVVLLALTYTRCASSPPLITSLPPPQEKPPTGTVMPVMTDAAPSAGIQQPGFVGRHDGCVRRVGSECFDRQMVTAFPAPMSTLSTPSLLLVMTFVGSSVRPPLGAAVGVPLALGLGALAVNARQSTRAVLLAFADIRVAETFVDEVLLAGRAYRVVPPIGKSPGTETPTVDTFLELEGPRISLVSDDITVWSPDLQLQVGVFARLLRAPDRKELGRWSWKHVGSTVRLADWSENDARLFRTELETALRAIASQAIKDLAPGPVQTDAGEKTR